MTNSTMEAPANIASQDLTLTFAVDQTPEEVFAAINNVRGWWLGDIEGSAGKLGNVWTFRYKDIHYSKMKIAELVPGKRVVWQVVDSSLSFVQNKTEWTGTKIVFDIASKRGQTEVRFTHAGLVPAFECYGGCSGAWGFYIEDSLRSLIATGKGEPNPQE
jgi:uncharacterized protein YndB with AHSA1/START domain